MPLASHPGPSGARDPATASQDRPPPRYMPQVAYAHLSPCTRLLHLTLMVVLLVKLFCCCPCLPMHQLKVPTRRMKVISSISATCCQETGPSETPRRKLTQLYACRPHPASSRSRARSCLLLAWAIQGPSCLLGQPVLPWACPALPQQCLCTPSACLSSRPGHLPCSHLCSQAPIHAHRCCRLLSQAAWAGDGQCRRWILPAGISTCSCPDRCTLMASAYSEE